MLGSMTDIKDATCPQCGSELPQTFADGEGRPGPPGPNSEDRPRLPAVKVIQPGTIRLAPDGDLLISGWQFEAPDGVDLLAVPQLAIDHEAAAILQAASR